ncbi:protein kinase [Archangium violaceum]|uniref:protein kinase domain-containing protein n=1 Tax=Archangium violaceum TaxID=83451 RepID=UPI002B29B895|nr:protein kinase [Archangium gephyra]
MSRDAPLEDGRTWPPTEAGGFSEASDSEDSFLKEVLQVEPSSRLPDLGEWLGGADGRRFQLLAPMGRGGMGQVFRAWDETLRREVALKFLLPRPGMEELALAEARAVARLDHENIVRIFDVAEWCRTPGQARVPFLVMECLEGEPLAGLMSRERPELRRTLELLEAIAAGLAHAHERGIVHRDLKPGNVFLTREDTVKLLDFGLSHLAVEPVRSALQPAGGTPAYMAPEQWRGEPQDARTDLWAVGVVLYELLTGELPFQGATLAELRERVTSARPAPSVRTRHPEIPRQVEALLSTLLAKEPARRFSSALELREELHELRGRLFGTGREVPDGAAGPQWRQVSLVSCQLSGLAEGGAPLDAEELGELELAFHEACVELIERHGGTVVLSMGGEVLACFGWVQGREDDSERAVRAGLQLIHGLPDALRHRRPHLSLSRMSVRGGVHTEWMAVGARLQGEAPKVAAWLAERAGPGGLAVSERTWTLVRHSFLGEPLGPQSFTGLSGSVPLAAHRVSCEREVGSRFARTRMAGRLSPLVGRERELGELLSLWARAQRGQGAFVLVSGEAGIGKSRLIEALCERAAPPLQLIRMQCWSRFSTQALHPVIELLQTLVAAGPEQPPSEHLRQLEAWGHAQEDTHLLASLLALPLPEDSPVLQLTPERRREKTLEALVHLLLHRSCDDAPVLLVLEDLHWADSNLLAFLGLLLERGARARLLVVLSARPEFQPDWSPHDGLHRLVLERLPAGLAAALVREVAQGHGLTEEAVQTLVEKTDGIPLFIEEMTRMVLEGGAAASIPLSLNELLLARLDLLPSRQRSLAQVGAVMGREFSYALLSAVAERDEARSKRELAGLMEAGLLRQREGAEGPMYEFRHVLLQEAAYQSLSRSARRRLHGRIARVLAERFPALVEARPEALAYHLTEAGAHAAAIEPWLWAGALALRREASPEALGHVTRALALWQGLPEAEQRPHEELRLRLLQGAAMVGVQGLSSPAGAEVYARVRELILQVGEALPRWEWHFWVPLSFHFARGEFQQVQELADRLVDLGQRHENRGMELMGRRMGASVLFSSGRPREAMAELTRVLARSELPLEELRRQAMFMGVELRVAAWAHGSVGHAVLGQMEESRRWGREALALAGRVGHPHTTAFMRVYVSLAHVLRGEAPEALAMAEQAMALSSERSFLVWLVWASVVKGWAVAELGRLQEGLAMLRKALDRWRTMGIRAGIPFNLSMLASILLKQGRFREALVAVEQGLLHGAELGEHITDARLHQLRGECLRRLGREADARRCFLSALAVAREQGAGLFELRAMVSLCRQQRDLGRTRAARRLLSRAITRFESGGDSAYLQEARALLDELQPGGPLVAPGGLPAAP